MPQELHLFRNRGLVPLLALALALPALAGCLGDAPTPGANGDGEERRTLTLMTHNSYYIGADVIAAFEAEHDVDVQHLPYGDAAEIVNAAILNRDNPIADVLFGVDNTLIERAKAHDVFEPYEPENANRIRAEFVFDPEWHVTPMDYGFVNVNYDKATLDALGLEPPTTLEALTEERWRGQFVVQNPATSSPGLAFLLTTVAYFGEDGDYTYEDYWRDLAANDVRVASGWEDAYFTHFAGGGAGDKALVVSYVSSPPYGVREACMEDGEYLGLDNCPEEHHAMPTGNADIPGSQWLQIEGMGVLRNAQNPDLARAFIEFALSPAYQESASFHMFMYPVVEDAEPADFFTLVDEPASPASLPASDVTPESKERWIDAWERAVIG